MDLTMQETGRNSQKGRSVAAVPAKARPAAKQPSKTPRKTPAPQAAQAKPAESAGGISLDSPELYLNRELTWLEFNRRVLHMADDERTPLLERVKFLAIVSSNLDEFFMKRIGGLKQQIAAGTRTLTVDGRSPAQQVTECHTVVREIQREQNRIFRQLLGLLREQGIRPGRSTIK